MEQLYFIAIVPPADIQDEITIFKQEIAERYGSSHALSSPPHITLHMPFRWKDKRFEELRSLVQELNQELETFDIELEGFDFFEPRVVFVDVVKNEKLDQLQSLVANSCRKRLHLNHANYKNLPFHPHLTIAFRDLKKTKFYEAKDDFKARKYKAKFFVNRIELLRHDGKQWVMVNES